MKWVIALTITLLVASSGAVFAQQPSHTASLADVARAEEARRKTARKATKVLTNGSLAAVDGSVAETPARPATSAGTPAVSEDEEDEPAQTGPKKDQAYWSKRISEARADLSRTQMFAESMQTRLNVLTADLVNLDYPARGVAEKQRNSVLAELERLKKEIEQKTKGIAAIEDEARRANVPIGWLRPPV